MGDSMEGNVMDYRIARNMPISATTATPHAVALSRCNTLAAISLQGIHVYEITANVTIRESFHLEHRFIPVSAESNPAQDPGIPRANLNRDIWMNEIHDVFLDRTISPARNSDEPYSGAFRQVCWSPLGLINQQNCILTGLTADHRVTLYGNGRWRWETLACPSDLWAQHLRSRRWTDVYDDENHSEVFSKFKNRSYMLGTIAIDWSPLYDSSGSKWAWLICLQRSGHLVVWKVKAPFQNVELETFFDLQIRSPASLKVFQGPDSNHLLIVSGTHQGLIKCHQLSWNNVNPSASKIHSLGHVISEADGMGVAAMELYSINSRCQVIICVKNNFVLFFTVRIDPSSDTATGNECQVLDQRHTSFQCLNISSLCLLDNGKIVCATEDYQLYEIEAHVDPESGMFREGFSGLAVRAVSIPNNPVMLCRGLAVSQQPAGMAIFVLESLKVPHDHLQCRQPSDIIVYVTENPRGVLETIGGVTSMKTALVALESYKALCGSSSDSIWEPEVDEWRSESVIQLQLVRWFALFKSHASSDSDTKDELKIRAQIAEIWLRLRHLEALFQKLVNRDESVTDEQRLTIYLAHEFVTVTSSVASNELGNPIVYDRALVNQLRKKYLTGHSPPEEPCGICRSSVAFDNMNVGKCPNGHQAVRCFATLRLCFERTLRCRWCGAHYRQEPVFEAIADCILCGGPTRIV